MKLKLENIVNAVKDGLNTERGQELVEKIMERELEHNPNLTVEEWQKTKQSLLTFLSLMVIKEMPEVGNEVSREIYKALQNA
jgi:hypothetical protein